MGQLVRALRSEGPQPPEQLRDLVGARWWDEGRFDRALALALADGVVHRTPEGALAAV